MPLPGAHGEHADPPPMPRALIGQRDSNAGDGSLSRAPGAGTADLLLEHAIQALPRSAVRCRLAAGVAVSLTTPVSDPTEAAGG